MESYDKLFVQNQGRRKIIRGRVSTRKRGLHADYTTAEKRKTDPYIVLRNFSEAVVNQDQGSKGMPPRHIHKAGMMAADKQVRRELDKLSKRMARAWAR